MFRINYLLHYTLSFTGLPGIWSPQKWLEAILFDAKGLIFDLDGLSPILLQFAVETFLDYYYVVVLFIFKIFCPGSIYCRGTFL